MRKFNLYLIVMDLLQRQNNQTIYTFKNVIDILMENTGYDDINTFASDLNKEDRIDDGNPWFKEALIHLYKKSDF